MLRNLTLLLLTVVIAFAATAAALAEDEAKPEGKPCPEAKKEKPRGPHSPLMKQDADKDGALTLDELIAGAKKLMADADTDTDGKLTADELKAFHQKNRPERPARPEGSKGKGEGRPQGDRPEAGRGGRGRGPGSRGGMRGEGGDRREPPKPEDIFKRLAYDLADELHNGCLIIEVDRSDGVGDLPLFVFGSEGLNYRNDISR